MSVKLREDDAAVHPERSGQDLQRSGMGWDDVKKDIDFFVRLGGALFYHEHSGQIHIDFPLRKAQYSAFLLSNPTRFYFNYT